MASASLPTVDNWKDFSFANLQQILDEQSSKISSSQEEGAASRKALSANTKAFKKLADDEKLNGIRKLLKDYQSEIDALTGRCKFAESCFMNVYRSLALLPDPEPLLHAKQTEIEKLKSEISSSQDVSEKDVTLARELERQTLRVAQLEKQLKAASETAGPSRQAAGARNDGNASSGSHADAGNTVYEQRINDLETALAEKESQLANAQSSLKDQTALTQKHQQDLHASLSKLAIQQDYEEIKQELSTYRAREGSPSFDSDAAPAAEAGAVGNDRDAVAQRRLAKKLEAKTSELNGQVEKLRGENSKLKNLVAKLEEDLSSMQSPDTFSTISGWTAVPRGGPGSSLSASGSAGGTAVSNIIVQQRDRYKKRMQELEELSHTSEAALSQAQKELQSAKRENYTLYDRIRQLQAGSAASGMPPLSGATAAKPLYEPSADRQLRDLDIDRRIVGMSTLNAKLVELSARVMVDQKVRTGITAYAAFIHLLAFLGIIF